MNNELLHCPRCRYEIRKRKVHCPHCGARVFPLHRWVLAMQILGLLYLLVVIAAVGCFLFWVGLLAGVGNSAALLHGLNYHLIKLKALNSATFLTMFGVGVGSLILLALANRCFKSKHDPD